MKTKKEIMEYLGIWEEYKNNEINQKAIREAEYIEQKYPNELNTEKYAYAFYGDMSRFYDNKLEEVNIIEDLECITVFEIKPKIKIKNEKTIKVNDVINIDNFDGDYICWLEVIGVPSIFIEQAKQIDGENYNSFCFGICVTKDTDGGEFWNVVTEVPIGQLFYIDNWGKKHWMKYELTEKEESQAIEFCKNYIKENNI